MIKLDMPPTVPNPIFGQLFQEQAFFLHTQTHDCDQMRLIMCLNASTLLF